MEASSFSSRTSLSGFGRVLLFLVHLLGRVSWLLVLVRLVLSWDARFWLLGLLELTVSLRLGLEIGSWIAWYRNRWLERIFLGMT